MTTLANVPVVDLHSCYLPKTSSFFFQTFFFFFVVTCSAHTSTQYFFLNLRMNTGSLQTVSVRKAKNLLILVVLSLAIVRKQCLGPCSSASVHYSCSLPMQWAGQRCRKSLAHRALAIQTYWCWSIAVSENIACSSLPSVTDKSVFTRNVLWRNRVFASRC